jgi:anti-sigma B factor antagonist
VVSTVVFVVEMRFTVPSVETSAGQGAMIARSPFCEGWRAGFLLCSLCSEGEMEMSPGLITEQPFLQVERTRRLPNVGLQCSGEIDLATVERLRRALTLAIDAGSQAVEVDMREVSFLDSSALRALLEAHRLLARTARRLCVSASPYGAKLFRITGIDQLFDVRANQPRANNMRP